MTVRKVNAAPMLYRPISMAERAFSLPREIDTNFLISYIEVGLALLEVARMLWSPEDAARCRTAALQTHDTILDLLSCLTLESSDRALVERRLSSLNRNLNSRSQNRDS